MKAHWARAAALLLVIAGGYLLASGAGLLDVLGNPSARMRALTSLRSATGTWWVGPAFSLAYAASVAVALPASVLTLLGGAAFGLGRGILWVSLGANLGASAGFCIARRLSGVRHYRDSWGIGLAPSTGFPAPPASTGCWSSGCSPSRPSASSTSPSDSPRSAGPTRPSLRMIGILPGTVIYVFFAGALLAGSAAAGQEATIRALLAGLLLAGFSLLTRWLVRRRSRHAS